MSPLDIQTVDNRPSRKTVRTKENGITYLIPLPDVRVGRSLPLQISPCRRKDLIISRHLQIRNRWELIDIMNDEVHRLAIKTLARRIVIPNGHPKMGQSIFIRDIWGIDHETVVLLSPVDSFRPVEI